MNTHFTLRAADIMWTLNRLKRMACDLITLSSALVDQAHLSLSITRVLHLYSQACKFVRHKVAQRQHNKGAGGGKRTKTYALLRLVLSQTLFVVIAKCALILLLNLHPVFASEPTLIICKDTHT